MVKEEIVKLKISRVDAFSVIALAVDGNKIDEANQMMKIISKSIGTDKKKNTFSSFIELTNKEVRLFQSVNPAVVILEKEE